MGRDGQERRYKAADHAAVRTVCLLVLLVNENGGISDEWYPNAASNVNASERCWLRLTKADGGTAACLPTDDFTGHGDRPHTALERFTARRRMRRLRLADTGRQSDGGDHCRAGDRQTRRR